MSEFMEHLLELLSDPAHLAFEVVTTLIIAGISQVLVYFGIIRKNIRREHKLLDLEHGHTHTNKYEQDAVKKVTEKISEAFRRKGPPPGYRGSTDASEVPPSKFPADTSWIQMDDSIIPPSPQK